MIYYVTYYSHKKKHYQYQTKSLTPYHTRIRESYGGRTCKCDTSIKWPFGVYAEIVAETKAPK
jgi:hypothetical protein